MKDVSKKKKRKKENGNNSSSEPSEPKTKIRQKLLIKVATKAGVATRKK